MEPKAMPTQDAGPGALLRQAREERRLAIDDVAQALRLSPRLISALEEDAYDRLPGPTYVRGYLRNYAQFLKLPPERLIDAFNARPEASQPMEMTAPAPVRQATSSDVAVRLGTVVIAAVVLGLVALWWSGQKAPPPVAGLPQSTATPPVQSAAEPSPEPASSTESTAPPPAPESETEPAVAAAAPASEPTPARAEPEPERPIVRTEPPPIDPNAPVSRLVLYVHEDSWADVRDARQQRLLYQTVPAGSVVTVEGVAPISVFLGNVAGVTVEFEGKPYDALRHRRGDIARFTLGTPRG